MALHYRPQRVVRERHRSFRLINQLVTQKWKDVAHQRRNRACNVEVEEEFLIANPYLCFDNISVAYLLHTESGTTGAATSRVLS